MCRFARSASPMLSRGTSSTRAGLRVAFSNVDILSFAVLYALCYALSGPRHLHRRRARLPLGCPSHVAAARLERNGIRRALPADAVSVARIHVESWKIAYRGIMPDDVIVRTDVAYRTKFWKERIADAAGRCSCSRSAACARLLPDHRIKRWG